MEAHPERTLNGTGTFDIAGTASRLAEVIVLSRGIRHRI